MMLLDCALEVLPLVDPTVLSSLEQQLNDPGPAKAFAQDYVIGFGDRFLRLANSIGNADLPAALDVALSLRSSSTMVGANRLSALAASFESAVLTADLETARRVLPEIERCGLDTIRELESQYLVPV
jgi:HPt (histidine-containing phosphotransfer) domain-containing protein